MPLESPTFPARFCSARLLRDVCLFVELLELDLDYFVCRPRYVNVAGCVPFSNIFICEIDWEIQEDWDILFLYCY